MPAVDQAYRTRRPKKKTTSRGPQGLPTVRTPVARPQVVSHSTAPAFNPLTTTRPFAPAQRQAGKRSQAARRKVPSSPILKRPPLLAPQQMTSAQRQALVRAGRDALNRARGKQSVQQFYETASPQDRKLIKHLGAVDAYERASRGGVTDPRFVPRGTAARDSHVGLPFASINVSAVGRAAAGLTKLSNSNTPAARLVKAGLGDVKTLATAPFVGAYELGAGTIEGLRDHPDSLAAGPFAGAVALARSERGQELGKGIVQSTAHEVTHPGESFREHPLLTALDVAGVGSVVGRTAGALGRAAGAEAASTVRPPLSITSDGQGLVERRYSKDLIRKTFQAAADSRREPVRDAHGKPVTVTQRGRKVPVLQASQRVRDRHSRKAGDFIAARGNAVERMERDRAGKDFRPRVRGKRGRDLVAMVTEGTIRSAKTFKRDLEAHRDRLRAEIARRDKDGGFRDTAERAQAVHRLETVERALADPKVLAQADKIVAEGERIGGLLNERERDLLGRGVLSDADRARRARLIPAAIEHHGGRHITEEEHARLESKALTAEKAARDAVERNPTPEDKAALKAAHDERVAVSGRDPRAVHAHERATETARTARKAHRQLQAKVARLRQQRARLVGGQAVHRGQEATKGPVRAYYVGDKRFETRAEAETFRKQHGGNVRVLARSTSEANRTGALAQLDRQIANVRKQAEAAGKAARLAERDLRRNPMPKRRAGIRTAEGKYLPNDAIEQGLRDAGRDPGTVAYLPHRGDVRGGTAHHTQLRPGTRPVMDKPGTRTGEAYRKGATEASADLLRDAGVRQATQLAKAEALDSLVADYGIRHPAWAKAERGEQLTEHERRVVKRNGYFTAKEAEELGKRVESDTSDLAGYPVLEMAGGERVVPMRAFANRLSDQTKDIIANDLQGPGAMESLGQRLLNDRVLTTGELGKQTARNVVLIPEALVKRLEQHLRPAGEIEKMLQMLNRPFRAAVLPQFRWLTGNAVEPYLIRLPGVGSGAVNVFGLGLDIKAANKTLKRMEKSGDPAIRQAAKEVRGQQFGGLLIGQRGATNRRPFESSAAYRRMVATLPATRNMVEMVSALGRTLMLPANGFFTLNRVAIEQWAQRAAFGRDVRKDIQEFSGSWLQSVRLADKAVDEAARGLVGTATQQRFMREQEKLLGKYQGYSPRLRALIQGPMPFLPWALSAARFTLWTLPAERTAQTALLIKTQQVASGEWEQAHSDTPPWADGLDFALRTKKKGYVDLARYTPWGLSIPVAEGNYQEITSLTIPQLQGFFSAVEGRDPFGRALKVQPTAANPTGEASGGNKLAVAGNSLLESMVPYLSTARRLREGGGTAFADSTVLSPKVKPGSSHMSAVRRTFDPFRPTYLNPPTDGKGSGKGGVDWHQARKQASGGTGVDWDAARKAMSGSGSGVDWKAARGG